MRSAKARVGTWLRAFKGFYDKSDPIAQHDLVARLLFSARSIILIISAQAAAIAGLLAYIDRAFNPLYFLLILIAFVTIHAASNLSNDYFGFLRGHDTEDSPRRRYTLHPLADSILTRNQMKVAILSLVFLNVAIGSYLSMVRGFFVVALAILGLLMMLLYDAAPKPLKSIGLGELASFVVWGPLMIFGGYFVIAGRFSPNALLVSIPYGLGVMTILVGKHIDQESYDVRKGIHTLPVIIGEKTARAFAITSIVLMYVFTFASVAYGALAVTAVLVLLNYKKVSGAIRILSRKRPEKPPEGYIGWPLWYHRQCLMHNKGFGWLYIIALLISAFLANTPLSKYEFIGMAFVTRL
jgi:1,4-dihydroxy-2-naphthoate octaprenyltransferase